MARFISLGGTALFVLVAAAGCGGGHDEDGASGNSAFSASNTPTSQDDVYKLLVEICAPYADEQLGLMLAHGDGHSTGAFHDLDSSQADVVPCAHGSDCGGVRGDFKLVSAGTGWNLELYRSGDMAKGVAPFDTFAVAIETTQSATGAEVPLTRLKNDKHDLKPEGCGTD